VNHKLLMKWLFVINHTICETEIPALLDSWVTNKLTVITFVTTKKLLVLIFS